MCVGELKEGCEVSGKGLLNPFDARAAVRAAGRDLPAAGDETRRTELLDVCGMSLVFGRRLRWGSTSQMMTSKPSKLPANSTKLLARATKERNRSPKQ